MRMSPCGVNFHANGRSFTNVVGWCRSRGPRTPVLPAGLAHLSSPQNRHNNFESRRREERENERMDGGGENRRPSISANHCRGMAQQGWRAYVKRAGVAFLAGPDPFFLLFFQLLFIYSRWIALSCSASVYNDEDVLTDLLNKYAIGTLYIQMINEIIIFPQS